MRLRLFTLPNCPRCPAAKQVAEAVCAQRKDVKLEVLDLSDPEHMTTALMLQIASTPSFAIEDVPLFFGEVPSKRRLNEKIDDYKRRLRL